MGSLTKTLAQKVYNINLQSEAEAKASSDQRGKQRVRNQRRQEHGHGGSLELLLQRKINQGAMQPSSSYSSLHDASEGPIHNSPQSPLTETFLTDSASFKPVCPTSRPRADSPLSLEAAEFRGCSDRDSPATPMEKVKQHPALAWIAREKVSLFGTHSFGGADSSVSPRGNSRSSSRRTSVCTESISSGPYESMYGDSSSTSRKRSEPTTAELASLAVEEVKALVREEALLHNDDSDDDVELQPRCTKLNRRSIINEASPTGTKSPEKSRSVPHMPALAKSLCVAPNLSPTLEHGVLSQSGKAGIVVHILIFFYVDLASSCLVLRRTPPFIPCIIGLCE